MATRIICKAAVDSRNCSLYPVFPFEEFFRDGPRIEAAFRKYFHRAPPSQTEDSVEVLVCHANVIRYFVCRFVAYMF